ncbi:MAG: signal recognition particle receptor subunit alpha, partial [Selenomonadales bacterium]|nr:signal recognition particle receptor subunit alpha [Selenomonadales bacterium]
MGFFDKLKRGLEKTRKSFTEKIGQVIMGYAKIDDDLLDDLEAIMISSDMGVKTAETLMEEIRKGIKKKEITGPSDLRPFLQKKIAEMFAVGEKESYLERPLHVIMVVGVNGVG